MGCSFTKSNPKDLMPIKIKPRISETASNVPLSAISRTFTVSEPRCLKFSIKEENTEDCEFITHVLIHYKVPCMDEIHLIFEKYHNYHTVLSLFESSMHGACIPYYDIFSGMKVLIIYLRINNFPKSKITVTKCFPYLNIKDDFGEFQNAIETFSDVVKLLKEFSEENKMIEALKTVKSFLGDSLLQSIQQAPKQSKSVMKALNKVLRLGYETNSAIEKLLKGLEEFSINLPELEKEIDKQARALNQFAGESIETIVHKIYL